MINILKKILLLLALAVALSGCQPLITATLVNMTEKAMDSEEDRKQMFNALKGEYKVNTENASVLKKALGDRKISVDEFAYKNINFSQIDCRLTYIISAPLGFTFPEFLKASLVEELKYAGVFDPESEIKLIPKLNNLDFTNGSWDFDFDLTLNSKTENFKISSDFELTIFGIAGKPVCDRAQKFFVPSVEKMYSQVFASDKFKELLK